MKIRHDDLKENGYILLDVLHHKELVPFIRTYLKKGTLFTWFYYLANLIAIFLVGFFFR